MGPGGPAKTSWSDHLFKDRPNGMSGPLSRLADSSPSKSAIAPHGRPLFRRWTPNFLLADTNFHFSRSTQIKMLFIYFAYSVAIFAGIAQSQTNLHEFFEVLPDCAKQCSTENFQAVGCHVANFTTCVCTNTELQRDIAVCVRENCSLSDNDLYLTTIQNKICTGVPYPSRSKDIIRDIIIMTAVTYFFITLRFISRGVIAKKLWWDDYAILVGAILMIPNSGLNIYCAHLGFGRHFWNIPPGNIRNLRVAFYVTEILYGFIQSLAKFSILFFYLRIFADRVLLLTKIFLAVMAMYMVSLTLTVTLQCLPIQSIWDITVKGKCLGHRMFAFSGINIFLDIAIILLPIPGLSGLNLNLRKKVSVMFMFAIGSFACITSLIRFKYIVSFGNSVDESWDNTTPMIWSTLEIYTAMICACIMSIKPLITKFLPGIFSQGTSNGRGSGKSNWQQYVKSKLRRDSKGMEVLREEDSLADHKYDNSTKTWVSETTDNSIELENRSV